MTNEELIARIYSGDESAFEQLYLQNRALIRSIVYAVATRNHVLTHGLLDDLEQEGALTFLQVIRSGKYDPAVALFSTYVCPFIAGAVQAYINANRSVLRISARETVAVCSLSELTQTDEDGNSCDPFDLLNFENDPPTVERAILNIELDVLRAQFARLTDKEQSILGSAFGVYGMEEQPLDDIALREMLTVNGVTKAKTRALNKLKELCESAGIHDYREAEKRIIATNSFLLALIPCVCH